MGVNVAARASLRTAGWSLEDVLAATRGSTTAPLGTRMVFHSVGTDSRQAVRGMLFVALRGERYDAHSFAGAALAAGARAALVEHPVEGVDPDRLIVCRDSLRALGDLAAWTRRRSAIDVVAVTGSNGKTTTKEMIASICAVAESAGLLGPFIKTSGNLNNLIGLPLTLLRLAGEESLAVLEMGMNQFGEIARLTEIAAPDYGVITNVGPAHLEGVGGTLAGVARAKGELFAGMSAQSAIAVNVEDEWVSRAAASFRGHKVTFGSNGEVQSRAIEDRGLEGLRFVLAIGNRTAEVNLPLVGAHNLTNALAAAAIGHLMKMPIEVIATGLSEATLPPERMQVLRLRNGVTLIDDAYNANPSSMEAAFRALQRMPGRAVVVLGDMRELGDESVHAHRAIGERAATCRVGELFALGAHAADVAAGAVAAGMQVDRVHVGTSHREVADAVISSWQSGDCILVKGSHGMQMEEVVRLLREQGDTG